MTVSLGEKLENVSPERRQGIEERAAVIMADEATLQRLREDACGTRTRPRRLTPQQLRVTELVSRGFSNKAIAHEMQLSGGTVRVYISLIFRRLGLGNRVALALWAVQNLESLKIPQAPPTQ